MFVVGKPHPLSSSCFALPAQQYSISLKQAATEMEVALKASNPFDGIVKNLEPRPRLTGLAIRPAGMLEGLDMALRVGHQGKDTP